MKTTKILSAFLAVLMIVSLFAVIPASAEESVDVYAATADGDLLYAVDYTGNDEFFQPGLINNRMEVTVDPEKPGSVTINNPGTSNEADWWGGAVTNLPLNDENQYTIFIDVTRPVKDGAVVNTSFGLYFDGSLGIYGYNDKIHWTHSGSDLRNNHAYVTFKNVGVTPKNDTTDTTQTQHLAVEVNCKNKTCAAYILDADNVYRLIDSTVSGELAFFRSDCLRLDFYNYTGSKAVTLSNTMIYKGLKIGECDTTEYAPEFIEIATAADVATIETGKNYKLTADIDMGGVVLTKALIEKYSGIIDGDGHSISNFSIDVTTATDFGLFQSVAVDQDTVFKNLKFGTPEAPINAKVVTTADSKSIGLIAGACANKNYGLLIDNVDIYANFEVPTAKKCNVGGFVGYARITYINDSTFNGKLTVGDIASTSYKNAAGFIGSNNNINRLKNCTNNAEISVYASTSEARAAGIMSYTGVATTLEGCINNGKVVLINKENDTTSDCYLAGILGDANGMPVRIISCVNNGDIEGATTCAKARAAGICSSFKKGTDNQIIDCKNNGTIAALANNDAIATSIGNGIKVEILTTSPATGDNGVVVFAVFATVAALGMATTVVIIRKRKKESV